MPKSPANRKQRKRPEPHLGRKFRFRKGQVVMTLEDGLPRIITKANEAAVHCLPGMGLKFWFHPDELRKLTLREFHGR